MTNKLTASLDHFNRIPILLPEDYQAIGVAVLDIAYSKPHIRRAFGLGLARRGEMQGVEWTREGAYHHLLALDDGENFALNSIGCRGEADDIGSVDQYLFGLNPRLTNGLTRLVHDVSGEEKDAEEYLLEARRTGALKRDIPALKRKGAHVLEVRGFRKAFFSVLKRPA